MKKTIVLLIWLFLVSLNLIAQWTSLPTGTSSYLKSVFFPDINTGYAVGSGGTIVKTTNGGTSWTLVSIGPDYFFNSVCFTDATTGYAAGVNISGGCILKTIDGGVIWTELVIGTDAVITSMFFTDAITGYATGFGGIIIKTTNGGGIWTTLVSPELQQKTFNSIYFIDASTGFAVGDYGTMVKTNNAGNTWTNISVTESINILSVFLTDAVTGYIVDNAGQIKKTINSGTTWTMLSIPQFAKSIYFTNANTGYAVGVNGSMMKTINGGTTWFHLSSGTTEDLISVYFINSNFGYVVGSNGTILKTTSAGEVAPPTVSTVSPTSITPYSAVSGGNVTLEGSEPVTARGVCWANAANPDLSGLHTSNGSGGGVFISNVATLLPATTYHVRAYATNSVGTSYGNDLVFSTPPLIPPTITTTAPTSITDVSAISGGNITSAGNTPVTARGICISYSAYPDITETHTTDGTGSGAFVSNLIDLDPATTYHIRAYATNAAGTSYGNDIAFSTICPPGFSLPYGQGFNTNEQPSCWTQVDHQGNGQVWQFGEIAGWTPAPALNYNYAFLLSGQYGTGGAQNVDLVSPLFDLSGYTSVTLGFNHYFKSSFGTFGKVSYSINNGSTWTAIQTFNYTTYNPAIFSQAIAAVAGQSQVRFKWNYTGGNGYYWAIDDVAITGVPAVITISTMAPNAVTTYTANLSGNIVSAGGGTILSRGVCWGLSVNPTIAGNHAAIGSGIGFFLSNITGLSAGTLYHVRAYATTSAGTTYGEDLVFTTFCSTSNSPPFTEGFTTTSIPNCWNQADHQGYGQLWQFGVITGYNPAPALAGNYAFLNSAAYGSGNLQDVDLISPLLDLSGYSSVRLEFSHFFLSSPENEASLYYSIDNGTSWNTIQFFYETTANPAYFSQVITGVAGHSQVRFKWYYFGQWGKYWAIDDVRVTGLQLNKTLTNMTFGLGSTACYNALQTITVAGSGTNFTVVSGGDVTLIAGQNIRFMPGTSVVQGGHLWGNITINGSYCVNPGAPFNTTLNNEESPSLAENTTSLFRAYPNPTTGKFTLELKADLKDTRATVRIYGMMGDEVLQENLSGKRKTEFSLSEKPNGIYIIRVMVGDKTGTAKVIKQE